MSLWRQAPAVDVARSWALHWSHVSEDWWAVVGAVRAAAPFPPPPDGTSTDRSTPSESWLQTLSRFDAAEVLRSLPTEAAGVRKRFAAYRRAHALSCDQRRTMARPYSTEEVTSVEYCDIRLRLEVRQLVNSSFVVLYDLGMDVQTTDEALSAFDALDPAQSRLLACPEKERAAALSWAVEVLLTLQFHLTVVARAMRMQFRHLEEHYFQPGYVERILLAEVGRAFRHRHFYRELAGAFASLELPRHVGGMDREHDTLLDAMVPIVGWCLRADVADMSTCLATELTHRWTAAAAEVMQTMSPERPPIETANALIALLEHCDTLVDRLGNAIGAAHATVVRREIASAVLCRDTVGLLVNALWPVAFEEEDADAVTALRTFVGFGAQLDVMESELSVCIGEQLGAFNGGAVAEVDMERILHFMRKARTIFGVADTVTLPNATLQQRSRSRTPVSYGAAVATPTAADVFIDALSTALRRVLLSESQRWSAALARVLFGSPEQRVMVDMHDMVTAGHVSAIAERIRDADLFVIRCTEVVAERFLRSGGLTVVQDIIETSTTSLDVLRQRLATAVLSPLITLVGELNKTVVLDAEELLSPLIRRNASGNNLSGSVFSPTKPRSPASTRPDFGVSCRVLAGSLWGAQLARVPLREPAATASAATDSDIVNAKVLWVQDMAVPGEDARFFCDATAWMAAQYATTYPKRVVRWPVLAGEVLMDWRFGTSDGSQTPSDVTVVASPLVALCLLCFNHRPRWSTDALALALRPLDKRCALALIRFLTTTRDAPLAVEASGTIVVSSTAPRRRRVHFTQTTWLTSMVKPPHVDAANRDNAPAAGRPADPRDAAGLSATHRAARQRTVEACIVRVLKSRHAEDNHGLFRAVADQLAQRFDLTVRDFRAALSMLVEREYVKRQEVADTEVYTYCA